MAAVKSELEVRPEKVQPDFHVYILEEDGERLGFCSLIPTSRETIEMEDLFVEPNHIGKGCGKTLWDYAVNLAGELGFMTLTLTADPNAETFYLRRGAVCVGEKVSPNVSDRKLPIMKYEMGK